MNTISIPNNTYYSSVNNKQKTEQNTNFKGYGVTDEGNVYKESNHGKYIVSSTAVGLPLLTLLGLKIFKKQPLSDFHTLTLLKGLIGNFFSGFGVGAIIDIIINKVRSNRADKRANELYTYVQNMNAPQQPYPQYQTQPDYLYQEQPASRV